MSWFYRQISIPIPGSAETLIEKAVNEAENFSTRRNPFRNLQSEELISRQLEFIVDKLLQLYALHYAPGAKVGCL